MLAPSSSAYFRFLTESEHGNTSRHRNNRGIRRPRDRTLWRDAVAVSLSGRDRLDTGGLRVPRGSAEMMQELTVVAFRFSGVRLVMAAVIVLGASASMRAQGPVDEVDPTIGNVSILLEPTRPTAYLPNSMVRMYPMRKDALDDQIQYFPLTILSHRQPELFAVMPGGDKPAVYDAEHATPYFYSTRFEESMIQTEFAPAHQAGYFRFTFPNGKAELHVKNLHAGSLHAVAKNAVAGEEPSWA